jgi:hypothetical protein
LRALPSHQPAVTGALKWQASTQTGVVAPPISYAIDDVQYIAVSAALC